MYKKLLSISATLLFVLGSLTFNSCGGSEKSNDTEITHEHQPEEGDDAHQHASVYQCPMQCEDEKTYSEPGNCPKCNMALEEVNGDHDHQHDEQHDDGHQH